MTENTRSIVVLCLIGLVAGFLASVVVGGHGGLIVYLISGLIGAFVGGFLLNALGVRLGIGDPFISQLVTATIGAIVVLIVAHILV